MTQSKEVTQYELRTQLTAIMRDVARGESFTITRNNVPVARLTPARQQTFAPREAVLAVFAAAPVMNDDQFFADLDAVLDPHEPERQWSASHRDAK